MRGSGPVIGPGAVIGGRYRVVGELGRGGFGVVLEAVHLTTGHPVAVKVLTPGQGADAVEMGRRFFREAEQTSRLSHPSTVRVFDFGHTEDGDLFLAMEKLSGETLQDVIDRGPLEEAQTVEIAVEVLRSLAEAHTVGLVHRDLKPANIFLHEIPGGDRIVKVLDFGIAKHNDNGMTQAGKALGTPTHMAPEQAMGKEVDARTDLYALGIVLFECLAGTLPFEADSAMALLMQHITEPAPTLTERTQGQVRPALSAVVHKAMAKQQADRWQTAHEMRQALQLAMAGPTTQTAQTAGIRATVLGPVAKAVPPVVPEAVHTPPMVVDLLTTDGIPTRLDWPQPPEVEIPMPLEEVRPAALRLTAWHGAADGQRVWWADEAKVVRTAALVLSDQTPVQLGDLAAHDVGTHETLVTAIAATVDGRLVVTGALDGTVRVWDPIAGQKVAEFRVEGAVTSLALATDGKLLVVGGQDGGAALVDLPAFQVRRVLRGHRGAVTAVAVASSRRLVATAGEDGTVRTWDPVGGGARYALRGHDAAVVSLSMSAQANCLASAAWNGEVIVWQTRSGEAAWRVQAHSDIIAGVALDRSGTFVATASDDRTAKVYRWGTDEHLATREDFAAGAKSVRFVDDALAVLVASWDATVRKLVW